MNNCHDCGAAPGTAHDDGCDTARCLWTGMQRLQCDGGHECGQDVWTGEWPGVAECREFGWYTKWTDNGWERCDRSDPEAMEDLNRLIPEARWDREAQRWVLRDGAVRGTG